MLNLRVLASEPDVNAEFGDFVFDRAQSLRSWIEWLKTGSSERAVTLELMATQAMYRQAHDLITGRITLGDVAEDGV